MNNERVTFDEAWEKLKSEDKTGIFERAEKIAAVEGEALEYAYDQGFKNGYELGKEEGKNERPTGKPVIVTCDDMSNYYICPCCRKPIDGWDRYCKHCGAEMESKEE